MSLTTRCPSCGTAFRVQPTQLSARGGKVRCGRCSHVFDGVTALVAEAAAGEALQAPLQDAEPSPQLALFEASRKGPLAADAANEETPAPQFLEEEEAPRRRWLWGLAAVLALLALGAQLALHFRTELVGLVPETRPHIIAACRVLGCELRLPRRPRLMTIESSDLQAEGSRDNVIVLNAVLRNQAPFAQELPFLELTLTDERDEAVARRVLKPADYLAGSSAERLAQGIGAGADAVLRLTLDTSGLRAVGYRLYLYFP